IKSKYPNKTIWLYTGFLWEEVRRLPFMQYIDVLVDGKFILELKNVKYHWAGSTNQRVIDVKKSLDTSEVVLYDNK
ncbi:MAG TPA: 4Fe-4S cluster-binding domain-containing protein, partial [Candidatus Fimicola cottocaccae]|nr:4Fe-4S cluster-binding domain-containing protein [Candidatus Fimicola cottocaccae]